MRTFLSFVFFAVLSLLVSCEDAKNDYFFENPVSGSVLKNVKCVNGSVSYIGFVVDNTEKYGARIMKISGCGKKIDKGFKDDRDDKTGIYIGGSGAGVDHVVKDGNVILGAISSGQVDYDHHKNDDEKLDAHRGRLVLRTLFDNFKHDSSMNKSVLLDFHPALIAADSEGFFVYGSYFGENYIAYITPDGEKQVAAVDFKIRNMVLSNGMVLLYNGAGLLFSVDRELSVQSVRLEQTGKSKRSGIAPLNKGRTALFYDGNIKIFDHNFNLYDELTLPDGYIVSSVSSAEYEQEYLYRSFPRDKMNEKVVIYTSSENETDNDSDENQADQDNEIPDTDSGLILFAVSDDDIEETVDTDNEVSDDEQVDEIEVIDAKEGDIIWIATETGNVLAYDLTAKSWMVTNYTEEDAGDVAEYSIEMRPYLESSFTSYPEYGNTNLDNAPFIKKISVTRGLAQSFIYNFTYEGIIEGSRSITGVFYDEASVLADHNADFLETGYNVKYDRVILLERKQNSECIIPLNTNITMGIRDIDSPTEMRVDVEKYADSISACYGDMFSYGIYTEDRYCVTREDVNGKSFVGRADELSAKVDDSEVSFSDDLIDISIMRKTDEVVTSKETNYYIKINPGVPFVGINSNDLIVKMEQTIPGKLLMFSPMTRRFIEYDFENRTVVEVYK